MSRMGKIVWQNLAARALRAHDFAHALHVEMRARVLTLQAAGR
jgi:hypothetical protein